MTKNLPKDVFLHLLSIITLVVVAVSFGVLSFSCINLYIPDVVSDSYYSSTGNLSSMRSALATLVIVFPVFLWVSWFIRKDLLKHPEKEELKVRKWLLYLTLFISALVIIGDLVALMRSFLEGELSQRFILKVVTIFFIAGSVFIHYLSELKEKKFSKGVKIFDWIVAGIVIATIVGGFFVAGSPQNQRLVRLDERRVSDLQNIQWQIVNYWQSKEVLPVTLGNLNDPIRGFIIPRDPSTGLSYGYNIVNDLTFELCAEFDTIGNNLEFGVVPKPVLNSSERIIMDGDLYSSSWEHGAGQVCFERTIDPDLYPLLNK